MEMQKTNLLLKESMISVSDLLKEAIKIPHKNTNFIIFTFLSSLPLLCFTVLYEMILQRTMIEASDIFEPPPGYFYHTWPIPFYLTRGLDDDFCIKLIQVSVLYRLPLHFLELFNAIVIVSLASKIHKRETPMTLKETVHKLIEEAKFKSPLSTSLYVLFLLTSAILGLIWLVTGYFLVSRNSLYGYPFVIFYAAAFPVVLVKHLELSAVWNMSIVISILEGNSGIDAIVISDRLNRGSERRGLVTMLVFFVWGISLRLFSLFFGCYNSLVAVTAQASLVCFGNAMKWVVCGIYYWDCKNRTLQKRVVDEEVGREVEAADAKALFAESEISQKVDEQRRLQDEAVEP